MDGDGVRDDNNCIIDEAVSDLPLLAFLPLGTGNGAGRVVGAFLPSSRRRRFFGWKRKKAVVREALEWIRCVAATKFQ